MIIITKYYYKYTYYDIKYKYIMYLKFMHICIIV